MPTLGGIVLNTVYSEDKKSSVKTPDHPIEGGLVITDHVEKEPLKFSISGVCAGVDAATRIAKLHAFKDKGERLTYVGRYYLRNMVIESISETKDVDTGGNSFAFDMQLKEMRIAARKTYAMPKPKQQPKVKPVTNKGKQQTVVKSPAKRYHVVVRGESLWKIAQKYYGAKKGSMFTLIYNANKHIIKNPNLIQPNWKLLIP